MRLLLVLMAGGLLLAACRTDGERGEAVPQERVTLPSGRQGPAAPGSSAEDNGTARILAATRAMAQSGLDAGKLAQQKASLADVKDFATRSVAEYQANLDALADLTKAKKIDLDAPAVQNDPLLRAQKETAKEALDKMRGLSGTAFDAAYMNAQRPNQALLVQLAQGGLQTSHDTDVGNVLRAIAQQGRDRSAKGLAILPKACGGERAGWGGAG